MPCKNICERLPFVIKGRTPHKTYYGGGLKRCTTCGYYANGASLPDGFRCPCCHYMLRKAPHKAYEDLKIAARIRKRM